MKSRMMNFFIEHSMWVVAIAAILSILGAILTNEKSNVDAKKTDEKLDRNNTVAEENRTLNRNVKRLIEENKEQTGQILELTNKVKDLSDQSFEITKNVKELTKFTSEYIAGLNSYCSLIHLIKNDTITFHISNKGKNPMRDLDVGLEYGYSAPFQTERAHIDVLYKNFEREVLKLPIEKEEPFLIKLKVHSNSGFFNQSLIIAYHGNTWKCVNIIKDENNIVRNKTRSPNFPDEVLDKFKIKWPN